MKRFNDGTDDSNGDVKQPNILKEASKELFSHRLPNGMISPLHDAYYFSKKLFTGKTEDKKQKKKAFSPADVVSFYNTSKVTKLTY